MGAQRRQQATSDFPSELGPGPHRTQTLPPPRPASLHCTAQTPGASGFLMLCGAGTRGSVHKQSLGEREGQPDREAERRKHSLTCIYSLPHLPLPSPFPRSPHPQPSSNRAEREWTELQGTSSSGSLSDSSQDTPSSCRQGCCSCFSELLLHARPQGGLPGTTTPLNRKPTPVRTFHTGGAEGQGWCDLPRVRE